MTHPARDVKYRPEVEPLAADLRRLHITVDAQFLQMVDRARDGLSHSIPGASTEQVLKVALELLLEKQARARGLVKRPRAALATAAPMEPTSTSTPMATPTPRLATSSAASAAVTASTSVRPTAPDRTPAPDLFPTEPPPHRRAGPRKHVPAATYRAVWVRDGGRCAWPLDGGGVCGSTHRLEIDHVVAWAHWGGETVDDLRIVCHAHNTLAARQAFGERCVARYSGPRAAGGPRPGHRRLSPRPSGAGGPRRGRRSAT